MQSADVPPPVMLVITGQHACQSCNWVAQRYILPNTVACNIGGTAAELPGEPPCPKSDFDFLAHGSPAEAGGSQSRSRSKLQRTLHGDSNTNPQAPAPTWQHRWHCSHHQKGASSRRTPRGRRRPQHAPAMPDGGTRPAQRHSHAHATPGTLPGRGPPPPVARSATPPILTARPASPQLRRWQSPRHWHHMHPTPE